MKTFKFENKKKKKFIFFLLSILLISVIKYSYKGKISVDLVIV